MNGDRVERGTPQERLDALLEAMEDREPSRELVEAVIRVLDDEHPGLRQAALETIGRYAAFADVKVNMAVVERAIELTMDDSAKVRAEAAGALALLADDVDHPPRQYALLRLLEDGEEEVRQEAAAALGDLAIADAKDPLADLLDDPSEDVRFEAAFALASMKDVRARPTLEGALPKTRRRLDAMKALGLLGDPAAAPALERYTKGLLVAWADRLTACATLYLLGDKSKAEHVLARTTARKLEERTYAVALIGTHRIVEGEAIVERIAQDKKDPLRDTAAESLAKLRT